MYSINCRGRLLNIQEPLVMGIINATPDSFYEGHLNSGMDGIVSLAAKMIGDGADILDVGGLSTRPGSKPVSLEEETGRVVPVIRAILKAHPGAVISVDTYNSAVAAAAVEAGAVIVNDISGGHLDEDMLITVSRLDVPYICMHMKGTPETMQQDPVYEDVVKEVLDFFIARIEVCTRLGIRDVIVDPGFGFGKTIEHNFQLLKRLEVFSILEKPLLVGLSRKGSIYKTLDTTAAGALNGTTVLNSIALMNGASILRVHDVKEAKEAVTLYSAYKKAP
ncbi:MAG: dihydropteroate synthase [Ferruginibacter sp.]|nr:dihydropteroate synthase [Chitinophagaceae bacterium]MBU9935148.1 dihydropteroate synthase [Ferruginibacter sp.]HQY11466.1 dihydropteroate synthase [Ferruginibacter sp.]